jgi:hypothetical protein
MFCPMSRKIHIVIDIPYEYPDRDRLTRFIGSKFPGADVSMVHQEISKPEVAEAMIEYDASESPGETAGAVASEDSRSVMEKVSDALAEFAKSTGES